VYVVIGLSSGRLTDVSDVIRCVILGMNLDDLEYKGVDWINLSRDQDGLL
jgi:hypothetical protein